MSVQTKTPALLRQELHQLVEQLPNEALPSLLHSGAQLVNGSLNMQHTNGSAASQHLPENEPTKNEQPWLPYIDILKDSPNWDEFEEAMAEYRRELDAENQYL